MNKIVCVLQPTLDAVIAANDLITQVSRFWDKYRYEHGEDGVEVSEKGYTCPVHFLFIAVAPISEDRWLDFIPKYKNVSVSYTDYDIALWDCMKDITKAEDIKETLFFIQSNMPCEEAVPYDLQLSPTLDYALFREYKSRDNRIFTWDFNSSSEQRAEYAQKSGINVIPLISYVRQFKGSEPEDKFRVPIGSLHTICFPDEPN